MHGTLKLQAVSFSKTHGEFWLASSYRLWSLSKMEAFWLLYSSRLTAPASSSSWSCLIWVINWPLSWACLPGDTPAHVVVDWEPTDAHEGDWFPECGFKALIVPSVIHLKASTSSECFSCLFLPPPMVGRSGGKLLSLCVPICNMFAHRRNCAGV